MARWHLTLGLSTAAIVAMVIAPRLVGSGPNLVPTPQFPDPDPLPAGALRVTAGLDQGAIVGHGEERFLVVEVSAPATGGQAVDRAVDLAVVIDASGSMGKQQKIDHARRAAKLLAGSLDEGDRFSLVTFSDSARVLIPAVPVTDADALYRAIDGVYESGGTNMYAGMEAGADLVRHALRPGMVGRIVVLSDGHANVGLTAPQAFERFAAEAAGSGVSISAIGLGRDYNEDLLARIVDLGGGSYAYVDDPRELPNVLSAELDRTASVVARGIDLRVTLPADVRGIDVLGWDATPTADGGWTVHLGDMYAGETRKVVARVRVDRATLGTDGLADVQADYFDLGLEQAARTTAHADATITVDRSEMARSVDRARSVEARRALGAWHLSESTRYWQAGDTARARQVARDGRSALEQAARDLGAPHLVDEAEQLRNLGYINTAPDSYEGRGLLKAAKEESRAFAR